MIRIGIIGIGGYASNHWRALEQVQLAGACEIVACSVIDPENHYSRLEELRSSGVEIFNDALEMFDRMSGKMDAVTIPTPIHTHTTFAIAAFRAGLHAYLEKPVAATLADHDEIIAEAKKHSKICAIGFQGLSQQSISLLKHRICEGVFGNIRSLGASAAWIRKREYFNRNSWAGRTKLGETWVRDGAVNNPLSHQLVNLLYLASKTEGQLATPKSLRAELYHANEIEGDDTFSLEVITTDDIALHFAGTVCADEQFMPEIIVRGDKATACKTDSGISIRYADGTLENPTTNDQQADVLKFENFIEAIEAHDPAILRCSVEMCRPFTQCIEAAYESSGGVRQIPSEFFTCTGPTDDNQARTIIHNIETLVNQCATQGKLLSELGAEWASGPCVEIEF